MGLESFGDGVNAEHPKRVTRGRGHPGIWNSVAVPGVIAEGTKHHFVALQKRLMVLQSHEVKINVYASWKKTSLKYMNQQGMLFAGSEEKNKVLTIMIHIEVSAERHESKSL